MIKDKFVKFFWVKYRGHVLGQGSTSSIIHKTLARYIDTASSSYNNIASVSTTRSRHVEGLKVMEQRLRVEHQQTLAAMRA
jgi:hypothetical protein